MFTKDHSNRRAAQTSVPINELLMIVAEGANRQLKYMVVLTHHQMHLKTRPTFSARALFCPV